MSKNIILVDSYLKQSKEHFDLNSLPISAAPGLHDYIFNEVKKICPKQASILELGCGSGAFSYNLKNAEYKVTSVDYTHENFRLHGLVNFLKMDLNEKFSTKLTEKYQCIVAIEILEHLENPRNFFRECMEILPPGGFLVFSTPNIDSPLSKYLFLRRSYFNNFSNTDYRDSGHITPISLWYLKNLIAENNYKVKLESTFGSPFLGTSLVIKFVKRVILYCVSKISKLPKSMNGEILVYVLQR